MYLYIWYLNIPLFCFINIKVYTNYKLKWVKLSIIMLFSNYFVNDKILIFIKMFCALLIFLGRTMQLIIIISLNFGDLLQSLVCFHRSTCKTHYCPPLLNLIFIIWSFSIFFYIIQFHLSKNFMELASIFYILRHQSNFLMNKREVAVFSIFFWQTCSRFIMWMIMTSESLFSREMDRVGH